MGIWQPYDFFFALLWALLSAGIHAFANWIIKQVDAEEEITDKEHKFYKISIVCFRVIGYVTAAFGVGTIALPLLDALLTALLGTAYNLFDKYGGLVLIAAVGVAWWKNRQPQPIIVNNGEDDPVEVEYAKQEAEELHDDLGELLFNAVVDTSENTPLKRPRDTASIETGREKPYTMEGMMAVHQYSVDTDTPLNRASEDLVVREL